MMTTAISPTVRAQEAPRLVSVAEFKPQLSSPGRIATVSGAARPRRSRRRKPACSARLMTLFHVTHSRNQDSIERRGLLPEKSTGKEKAVWLLTKSLIWWALMHTVMKPGRGPLTKLVVYRCEIPRNKLRRYGKGTWRCFETVRPGSMLPATVYAMNYPDNQPG
jgi:hypothetical protein